MQAQVQAVPDGAMRACHTMFYRNYFPTRFTAELPLSRNVAPRAARLALPFLREDYASIRF